MANPEQLQPFWLQGEAGLHDVVLSTRFRLARNLQGITFPSRADLQSRLRAREILEDAVGKEFGHWRLLRADHLPPALRELFFEKHLIPTQLVQNPAASSLAISTEARFVLLINEEDHLRIQLLLPGWSLLDSWPELLEVETRLSRRIDFATDPEFGYLTSCITNLGTGLRASVMVHLPGLNWYGNLAPQLEQWPDEAIEFRGIFGEGSGMQANFVQVSNCYTLGSTTQEITQRVNYAVEKLVKMERVARDQIYQQTPTRVQDQVHRALATLRSARLMTSEEATYLLGTVRLGACLGILPPFPSGEILRLLIGIRPAHLHLHAKRDLGPEERDFYRANYIRSQFSRFVEDNCDG